MSFRSIQEIAADIRGDWTNVNGRAEPFLRAMESLDSIHDYYVLDSAAEIVGKFLAVAGTWRGPIAREIKAELNEILDSL
jgi:hypothetical protein